MSKHICIIAGEASGDFLGAQLIKALKAMHPNTIFSGVGGPQMNSAGLESLFPYEELAVMGVAEVLPKLPGLIARIHKTAMHILKAKPDVVVTIDSPDFCFRVVKAVRNNMKKEELPKFVHYVAPTVWAWREGRAAKVAQFLDGMICLFDFEPPYFEKHGLKATAVGHPLVEGGALQAKGADFREEYGIGLREPVIGVLFGSRRGELIRTGKDLRDAAFTVAERLNNNSVHIVAPTLPHVKDSVYQLLKDAPCAIHITDNVDEKYAAFKSMNVALAVSGTVGLELAALQVPHVIGYKMNPLTAMMVRTMVKVKYAHLANIMADKEIVPEFIQDACTSAAMADRAFEMYQSPQEQVAEMAGIAARLGAGQKETPSQKAAAFVLGFVR